MFEATQDPRDQTKFAYNSYPEIERIVDRIEEFTQECPVCYNTANEVVMLNCCSYCVCSECFSSLRKCAFCRKPIVNTISVDVDASILPPPIRVESTLDKSILVNAHEQNFQMKNMIVSLNTMLKHDCRRLLLMINFSDQCRHIGEMIEFVKQQVDGIDIEYADDLVAGKGTKFARIKQRFDDTSHTEPMVLVCNNYNRTGVLIGVNFNNVDGVLLVGEVCPKISTQLMGRIFRPNPNRDNTRLVPFVKVYSKRYY